MGIIFFIIAVFGFGILVFFHELGHFIMGKLFKIRVETFSIGMGPAIFGFKKGETFYQVGAVPIGGFCKFKGEESFEDLPAKISLNVFEDIKGKLNSNTAKGLFLNSYNLRIPEVILKEDFEKTLNILTKRSDKDLLNDSYEFDSSGKLFNLKDIEEVKNKKLIKIFNDNNSSLLKYSIKNDISEKDKKNILKTITSEIKIYKLRDPDSFYGAAPFKRLLVVLFGPLMNYIIAVVFLSIVAMISKVDVVSPKKIFLLDDYYSSKESNLEESKAKKEGLLSSDTIIKIDDVAIDNFNMISEYSLSKYITDKSLPDIFNSIINDDPDNLKITVERNGELKTLEVKPKWDPESLRFIMGIAPFYEPVIKNNEKSLLNKRLGLIDGDIIIGIDDDYENMSAYKIEDFLILNFSKNKKSILHVKRGINTIDIPIIFNEINHDVSEKDFYLAFEMKDELIKGKNIIDASIEGYKKSVYVIKMSVVGLYSIMFNRPKENFKKQVGGPLMVGYAIGAITVRGFEKGILMGLIEFLNIISLISLGLAFMNLLPIPALDGGHLLFNTIEIVIGKPISIKVQSMINMIFFFILISLIIFIIAFFDIPNMRDIFF